MEYACIVSSLPPAASAAPGRLALILCERWRGGAFFRDRRCTQSGPLGGPAPAATDAITPAM